MSFVATAPAVPNPWVDVYKRQRVHNAPVRKAVRYRLQQPADLLDPAQDLAARQHIHIVFREIDSRFQQSLSLIHI